MVRVNTVVFVSEARDPYQFGSSTQIMTYNLLYGLKAISSKVIFIAIIDNGNNIEAVREYYKLVVDEFIPIYSKINLEAYSRNKYKRLFKLIKSSFTSFLYKKFAKSITIKNDYVLLSHSPSVETILLCKEIRAYHKPLKYIQYWSDPITISGIYPSDLNLKRLPYYLLEQYLLSLGDEIVYGTKLLYDGQHKLFKQYKHKMRYVHVSYSPTTKNEKSEFTKPYTYGYTGNYTKEIRNILPLYNAFHSFLDANLFICGTGNVKLESTNNITVHNRYPQGEISAIEATLDIFICICNYSCLQIPGKVFYQANSNKVILVILDGKYKRRIKSYLEEFQRFEFCYNNVESIVKALKRIQNKYPKVSHESIYKLSPEFVANQLLQDI